jgi:hypothetical protein
MSVFSLEKLLRLGCLALVLLASPELTSAGLPPVIFYSDLDSGPNSGGQDDKGVFATVWGKNFGMKPGTVGIGGGHADNYPHWSDTKITFQLGPEAKTGNIVVTTADNQSSNSIPFTVRPGRIFFVSAKHSSRGSGSYEKPWRSPASFYGNMRPGDTLYFREGTYAEQYGETNWGSYNFTLGSATGGAPGKPIAFVGYPGETAIIKAPSQSYGNFTLGDSTETHANYVTIANLTLKGADFCIGGGGWWERPHGGATNVRVVGNILSASYSGNTMTGLITVQNDNWRVLGNEMKDTGTGAPINNNHGIYNQAAASNTEIAWNYFHDLRMGGVIQVHTDPYYVYTNVRIHDNVIAKGANGDSRGITIGNALTGTYGSIYNNIFDGIGQDFGAIGIGSGDWKIYNNTFYNIYATGGIIFVSNLPRQLGGAPANWAMPTADIKNNIIYSDGQSLYVAAIAGASMSQMTLSNNLYFGYRNESGASKVKNGITADPLFHNPAVGDVHLRPGSPAIDQGSDTVAPTVTRDHDGVPRPQGRHFDVGAFEAVVPPR